MRSVNESFNFPVRVYDRVSISKVEKTHRDFFDAEKEIEEETLKEEPAWVRGWMRVPVDEIRGWGDAMSIDEDVKEVAENGFKLCIVMTKTLGDFMCTWSKEKFEIKLEEFLQKQSHT